MPIRHCEKIQIFAWKRVFLKQPKIDWKPFTPRPKGFLWEKWEFFALYTLRILKYNFILKINFAYPALRKNPNLDMKMRFFKQPKIGRKPFRPRPKGFLLEKMEILALYTLRISKYKFILEINLAYPVLRKKSKF